MKKILNITILIFITCSCGQKGNHTGLLKTDYSLQKTENWIIQYQEDEKHFFETKKHRRLDILLVKKTAKENSSQIPTIKISNDTKTIISNSDTPTPKITITDQNFRDHVLQIPVVANFIENEHEISFTLTNPLAENVQQEKIVFCEGSLEENIKDTLQLTRTISKDHLLNESEFSPPTFDYALNTSLELCEKKLAETYSLTVKSSNNDSAEKLFSEMGITLNKLDLLHLENPPTKIDSKNFTLHRYHYIPLKIALSLKENIRFHSLRISKTINLLEENMTPLELGTYQNITFHYLKPVKSLKTNSEHRVELKREIIFHPSCIETGARKSCEKGKVVETDIGPNLITDEEIITFEAIPQNNQESLYWQNIFFSDNNYSRSKILPISEKPLEEIFVLRKNISIHYPHQNKPSGLLESFETTTSAGPKLKLDALKIFHQMNSQERSYSLWNN